jgi:riboflavin biosynthesis pyrimidine reductase
MISDKRDEDRFVMGLLRACADAVFMGAGTLRLTPGHRWTAEHVYPALTAEWAQLRASLGKPAEPLLAVVTHSGDLDVAHPAIRAGALILTTTVGKRRLEPHLPGTCELIAWDTPAVDLRLALQLLRDRGFNLLLSEAGPNVTSQLIDQDLLDELFLTVSPLTAGRSPESRRPAFDDGIAFLPERRVRARLMTLRRAGDYIFARYSYR